MNTGNLLSKTEHWMDRLHPFTKNVIVFDCETTGLRWQEGHRPFMCGLASPDGHVHIDPILEKSDILRWFLADPTTIKVGHNVKFDIEMMMKKGFVVRGPFIDTMILTQLANDRLDSYALKRLAVNLLGERVDEETSLKLWLREELRRRRAEARKYDFPVLEPNYSDAPRGLVTEYLKKDLEYTMKLLYASGPRAMTLCPEVAKVEMALIPVIVRMEMRGIPVNVDYFQRMADSSHLRMDQCQEAANEAVGEEGVDIGSNKQLKEQLIDRFGMKCMGWTDKGNPKFDKETLPLYDHPLARAVLGYRKEKKLADTYYRPLADMGRESGGLIHANFKQTGARRTGRMSCADPNLQNMPRKDKTVRRGFVCRSGFVNFYLDYSQIEMRLFAHYANSRRLMDIFAKGGDVHLDNAVSLFGEDARCRCANPEKCVCGSEQLRFVGKTINFGILYGMGARSFRKQLRKRLLEELEHMDIKPSQTVVDMANITESGTRTLLHRYYKNNPEVRSFMTDLATQLHRDKRIVDIYGKPYNVPEREDYKAVNYLIQGTAAGVLKRAMLRIDYACENYMLFRRDGKKCGIINVVHDEVVVETPWQIAHAGTAKNLVLCMEDNKTFKLPITVDVAVSRTNWAEKEGMDLAA